MTYLAPCGCYVAVLQKGQRVPTPWVRVSIAEQTRIVMETPYWAAGGARCDRHLWQPYSERSKES